ncbi:MAG: nreB 1, partial [Verrucomicrobia bacterium]|nr:nreB 1 [Verrucomicrobiota bacterium]
MPPREVNEEITSLIETLLETERRLEELTLGEVDSVVGQDGRMFLLARAQEQLRHSEASKEAAILNALPAHIALLDTVGNIVSTNEAWRRFAWANVGLNAGQATGSNYLKVCDQALGSGADDARRAAEGIRAVLSGREKVFSMEYACHAPAEQRWFLMRVNALAEDRQRGAVVMHINITQRKLAEEYVQASEANMALAQRIAHIGSWELKLTDEYGTGRGALRWSDESFRIAGYEPGAVEVSNELFFRLVHPDDREPVRQAMETAIRERREYSIVHRLVRPDGETRVVQETAQIFFDETTGQPAKIVGTAHDITERDQSEQALRTSEQEQRGLAERVEQERARLAEAQAIAKLGSWELDFGTNELIWSDENYRIFEINRDQFGASYEAFLQRVHPDDRAAVHSAYTESIANHKPYAIDHRLQMEDGSIKFVNERCRTFYDDAGKPIRSVGTTHDITERKLAERATKRALQRLTDAQRIARIGDWEWDLATQAITWSPQVFALFGRDP